MTTTAPAPDTDQPSASADLTIRHLRPDRSVEVRDRLPSDSDGVMWVDVRCTADVDTVVAALSGLDDAIDRELVEDLLERDPLARVDEHPAGLRHVTMVGLKAPHGWQGIETCQREMTFQMIEVFVGEGWLLTCWHESTRFDGWPGPDEPSEPVLRSIVALTEAAWRQGELTTAGDVATSLAGGVTRRYKQPYRALDLWLQEWEINVHAMAVIGREQRDDLKQLLALVNETRRHLAAFNNARSLAADGRWFPGVSSPEADKEADDALDRTLAKLLLLFEGIRADLDMVCMETLAHQAEIAEQRAVSERRFQEGIGRITALLLVPTLIAGIFGANTWLPGGGATSGFEVMVVLMVLASAAVYWGIVRQPRAAES